VTHARESNVTLVTVCSAMTAKGRRVAVTATAVALALVTAFVTLAAAPAGPVLLSQGIAAIPCSPGQVRQLPATTRGQFDPGTSVLRTAVVGGHGGSLRRIGPVADLTGCTANAERASRHWLRSGLIPGAGPRQRAVAVRALLDLRLLARSDGAVLAGPHSIWRYAWPRDCSWVAVALAETGHLDLSLRILRFLQRMQSPGGTWAARYLPSGSGPVRDGRPAELDAVGWVPWATWAWITAAARHGRTVGAELSELLPMVTAAAGAAERSLTGDGLPRAAMDYWEDKPIQVTLGTAAPLLAGLRAAAAIADQAGDPARARRWTAAAARLSAGIGRGFGRYGFHRVAFAGSGDDAAVTFLGLPFAVPGSAVVRAADFAADALQVANGGMQPGSGWTGTDEVAWTPETAFFALFDAGIGRTGASDRLLDWLAAHRTRLGELPEQVDASGAPVSVAPLAWTDAVVLLAMLMQAHRVPTIPAAGAAPAG
jgi:glucoamylase